MKELFAIPSDWQGGRVSSLPILLVQVSVVTGLDIKLADAFRSPFVYIIVNFVVYSIFLYIFFIFVYMYIFFVNIFCKYFCKFFCIYIH